jgi:hypothetical protein
LVEGENGRNSGQPVLLTVKKWIFLFFKFSLNWSKLWIWMKSMMAMPKGNEKLQCAACLTITKPIVQLKSGVFSDLWHFLPFLCSFCVVASHSKKMEEIVMKSGNIF